MFKILLLSSTFLIALNQTYAVVLTWDDFDHGTGLHVLHQGQGWHIRETQRRDTPFHQELFQNPEVYKTMANGKPWSKESISQRDERHVRNFSEGIPKGSLILEKEERAVGFLMLAPKKIPGVGDIIRALAPEAQGKGLGKASLGFLVEDWAPALRRRALGLDTDKKDHPTVEKFRCFGGEPLNLISTTARPSNPASWQCYKHFNFLPSHPTDATHQISCETWESTQHGPFEDYIVRKHFSETSAERLQYNILYSMLDETATPRTLSFVEEYDSVRYHFERKVF
ncbi:MAG TPA: GNAT family N-acetyltransferase [Alphaproteobacteria bacterium]|nr:GNAT family N-acetyltransferase [Alphaproteobacteria bacterium]HQS94744.1 GNAT family N-acetyltransferase [Alphaproteobacteria bacterium]